MRVDVLGLSSCVYPWTAHKAAVSKLCDLTSTSDTISSISWVQKDSTLAVGTLAGRMHISDANTLKILKTIPVGADGALAWNSHVLSSGSRDRMVHHRDVREPSQRPFRKRAGHRQELGGLKWSGDSASGGPAGNPMLATAVKALAWDPHVSGVLAISGGTQDKHLRFWNVINETMLKNLDTGSQVCNLIWSQTSHEQIYIWKYPSLSMIASLTGHTDRIIVTGAGDEALRFWNAFLRRDGILAGGKLEYGRLIR
ncbi:WD40 repeat-like protein [Agrocybe pediades]|nr:WD40 repeat-like protein [Agrocybe pediades]